MILVLARRAVATARPADPSSIDQSTIRWIEPEPIVRHDAEVPPSFPTLRYTWVYIARIFLLKTPYLALLTFPYIYKHRSIHVYIYVCT